MAENTVVKEQLTEEMIEAGAQLTDKLVAMGLPIAAAMWFFRPDINEWRLLFASSDVSTAGPLSVYAKIQEARRALGEKVAAAPFSVIGLLDEKHILVRLLREIRAQGVPLPVRISKDVTNGHFIEDAHIYRVA